MSTTVIPAPTVGTTDVASADPHDSEAGADVDAGQWVDAAAVRDVPEGWILTVALAGGPVALANESGRIHAMDAICGHAGGPLGDTRLRDACFIECPWHAAAFDVRSGEVVAGPARKAQQTYATRVRGTTIQVLLDD